MTNVILNASGTDNGGSLDHLSLRRNIVHSDFLVLYRPKPVATSTNVKPKNQHSAFLFRKNLIQATKEALGSQKRTKKSLKRLQREHESCW